MSQVPTQNAMDWTVNVTITLLPLPQNETLLLLIIDSYVMLCMFASWFSKKSIKERVGQLLFSFVFVLICLSPIVIVLPFLRVFLQCRVPLTSTSSSAAEKKEWLCSMQARA